MTDLDYAKVMQRIGLTVGDGPDPDETPDTIWCDGGTVQIVPLNTYVKVAGGLPVPWTGGNAVIECAISTDTYVDTTGNGFDGAGYLLFNGKPYVWVVDLTSAKVNPSVPDGATHQVNYVGVTAAGTAVSFPSVKVRLTAAGDGISLGGFNDLTILSPVAPGEATPIYRGLTGVSVESMTVNGLGELEVLLDDGTTVNAGALPVGPGGSDAGVAGYIGTPGSDTETVLTASTADAISGTPSSGLTPKAAVEARADARVTVKAPTKGAPNLGVSLTLLTDAQRLAYTPSMGESVYATDTTLFYIGDGSTVGGVASGCGFTADQLVRLGIVIPRHSRWLPAVQYAMTTKSNANVSKPLAIGNSITQGDGGSGGNSWRNYLGDKLAAYTGVGTTHWYPNKVAVSGAYVPTMVTFLADYQDPANYHLPKRSLMLDRFSAKLVFLMEMRNSASFNYIASGDYGLVLRAAMGQISRHNADCAFFIENVQINPATGVPYDNVSGLQVDWDKYYQAGLRVAADMGASVIDTWAYYNLLYRLGVDLRPLISADGEHPNNRGYQLMAELAFVCIMTPPRSPSREWQDKPMTDGRSHAIANYANLGAIAATAVSASGFGSLNNDTGRGQMLNQALGSRDVYVVPDGSSVTFRSPGPVRGVVVSYLKDPDNTGRAEVRLNGVLPTAVSTTIGARWDGYAADGVTKFPDLGTSVTRQFDVFYATTGTTAIDDVPGELTVTAVGGQIAVFGAVFIAGGVQSHPVWPDTVNTGVAPVADTFADNSETARKLTTAGDSDTLTFYGTSLSATFESGPNAGRYNVSIDGAAAGADVELWSTLANRARKPVTLAKNLALGWHTVKVTVSATKFGSSTGFDVKYGRVHAERGVPDPTVAYMPLASGEVAQLTEYWKYAQIERVISGSPTVLFSPGAASITLGTTGAAWVRLSR